MNLTIRQRDLMLFIQRYVDEHQCSPSFDEMKVAMGLKSKSNICVYLDELDARGFVRTTPHRSRCIEIVKRLPDVKRGDVVDLLAEAERLYSTTGLIANDAACGAWINATRDALAKLGRRV